MRATFLRLSLLALLTMALPANAQKKTIHVVPEGAKIFVDGNEVGNSSYTVKFNRNIDFFLLKFEYPGYITRNVKLMKSNPNRTVSYTLMEDEAMASSVGGETDGVDVANKWFDVTCRKGLTEDVVWKRLMNIAVTNFENVEVRDKAAGWIKTGWRTTTFTSQVVRTRMEVRLSFSEDDVPSYRVRITSEIKNRDCIGNQCFIKYNRVLKQYESVIQELQTTVGSNL